MPLKNYTSSVSASRSISQIEAKLAAKGATHIIKEYDDGRVVSIAFTLMIDGLTVPLQWGD